MAERPFLISPLLNTNFDVINLDASQPGKEVDSVTFAKPEHESYEFRDTLKVRLYAAPGFPHAAKEVSVPRILADVQGRVFWPLPSSVESAAPAQVTIFHGTSALMVRAPSKIVVDIPRNASSFSGYLGVPEEGATEDAKSQGVAVSMEVQDKSGRTRRRLDRILKPSSHPEDRGRFSFHIPIESSLDRTIKLSTIPVSAGGDEGSLSFWSQCRFEELSAGRTGP
jgi:hypothetical protein